MVFYFRCGNPDFVMFMGRDKFENEDLIKYGFPEDVWFHVEHLSSAHVYIRCPIDTDWEALPEEVVHEACQIVKQNSIEGCKKDRVEVVYTPWNNLKKTSAMDVGQVGFKNEKAVRTVKNVSKDRDTVKRLIKTRTEAFPDLQTQKADRDREEINRLRRKEKERVEREKEDLRERQERKKLQSYHSLYARKPTDLEKPKGDGTVETCRSMEEEFM